MRGRFAADPRGNLICWECAITQDAENEAGIWVISDLTEGIISESHLYEKSLCDVGCDALYLDRMFVDERVGTLASDEDDVTLGPCDGDVQKPAFLVVLARQALPKNVSAPVVVDVWQSVCLLRVYLPVAQADRIVVADDSATIAARREAPAVHVREDDDGLLQPLRRVNRLDGHRVRHPPERFAEPDHVLGVRLVIGDRVERVECVPGSLQCDRPPTVDVVSEAL